MPPTLAGLAILAHFRHLSARLDAAPAETQAAQVIV
jgi:hypothetical protein